MDHTTKIVNNKKSTKTYCKNCGQKSISIIKHIAKIVNKNQLAPLHELAQKSGVSL